MFLNVVRRVFWVPDPQDLSGTDCVVMMVTACRSGGECPYLQRRRCLFGHSAEEVAAALLVGSEAPCVDVLDLAPPLWQSLDLMMKIGLLDCKGQRRVKR